MRHAWMVLWLVACGGSSGAPIGVPCNELSRVACGERADCAVDVCFGCSCTPAQVSCRRADDAPFECPQLECATPECCVTSQDCEDGTCYPPGQSASTCGICTNEPGDCLEDADCDPLGLHRVCDPIACSCQGERRCAPGCTLRPEGCPEGSSCNAATERCEASSCQAGCPEEFDCGDTGRCVRRACTGDAECTSGFCVSGACYAGLGSCQIPAP